jgi:hypothetical protein
MMMIARALTTCAALMLAPGAMAQTATHAGSHNPAIKNSDAARVATPAVGRNSFSQDQARGRLGKAGYTAVSRLTKDDNGVWRGTAMRGGKKVQVGLDYKGNVTTR